MMAMELARIMASAEGRQLFDTLKRLVESQGLSISEVMKQSVEHMERMEDLAKRSGFTLKQIADGSLAAYEARLTVDGKL